MHGQAEIFAQLVHGAGGLYLPRAHQRQAVYAFLYFSQYMRGQDDGRAALLKTADDAVEFADADGVQARGRFIQKEYVRLSQQRLRESQTLAHAFGIAAHPAGCRMIEAHRRQYRLTIRFGHAFQVGKEPQRLKTAQVVIKHNVFRKIADATAHPAKRFAVQRAAVDQDLSGIGFDQAEHRFEQGAFACAVVADQPENFAARDGQADIIQGMNVAERFFDVHNFNDVVCQARFSSP